MDTLQVLEKGFDYGSLEPATREAARDAAAKIKLYGQRAAESIVAIGKELIRARDALRDDGTFLEWVRQEFDWSKSRAYRFIDVAEAFPNLGSAGDGLGQIDVSALYLLARDSTPEPVREAALERAAAGERVTHAAVRARIESFKRKAAEAAPVPAADPVPPAGALPELVPVAVEPAPEEDLDEPRLSLPEPAPERAERSPEPAPAPDPAEDPAPDLASEFAALHRRLTALGRDAKEVARAVPPAARWRHLNELERVLGWLELYFMELQSARFKAA
jgi:hypothetical protein